MAKSPIEYMESWIGAKQFDNVHKFIVDSYNTIVPLPGNYVLKYTDAWCAGTVSAAYHLAGLDKIFPSECSCNRMIKKAQSMGIWIENDAYVPSRGDCVLYDWQDNGIGDCVGTSEHVGMVQKVENGYIYVVEGNYSKSVKVRKLALNGKFIRGFVAINKPNTQPSTKKSNEEIAQEVIDGKWGTGNDRRQKLINAGYDYQTIQSIVNQKVKK